MTEKEWEKVHLGSVVEYSTFNLASFIFGGLIYGGYHDFHRTEVLEKFTHSILKDMKSLESNTSQLVDKHFWDLV